MTYEVHITVDLKHNKEAQQVADKHGWKTSEIARDIILGQKSYFYLTQHFREKDKAFEELASTVYSLTVNFKIPVIRQKIELIIFDTKESK